MYMLGLCDQVLVVGGYRGNFCEQLPQASPYVQETVPAGSKRGPSLAKAKPINDGGSTSVITFFRQVRSFSTRQDKSGEKKCQTTMQTPRSVKKEKEVLQASEQRFP